MLLPASVGKEIFTAVASEKRLKKSLSEYQLSPDQLQVGELLFIACIGTSPPTMLCGYATLCVSSFHQDYLVRSGAVQEPDFVRRVMAHKFKKMISDTSIINLKLNNH